MSRRKRLTVNDVLDIILEDPNSPEEVDVILQPPDGNVSDGYDDSDEDDNTKEPDKLSAGVLQAPAELRRQTGEDDEPSQDEDDEINTDLPSRSRTAKKPTEQWKKQSHTQSKAQRLFPEPNYQSVSGKSPEDLFYRFWNEEVMELITKESNEYAARNGMHDELVTNDELYSFLGILLLSGYCTLTNLRMYWQESEDTHNGLVSRAMTRERFKAIKRMLHFNGIEDKRDRYWKVRPLISHLRKQFIAAFIPDQVWSHDEAMIKYFGRHGLKQAIRNKPIRFGFKVWCLNTPDGYLICFELYQGEGISSSWAENVAICGKSGATVLDFLEHLPDEYRNLPFHIFGDNYFTSTSLMRELVKRGYEYTGTIRQDRISGCSPLTGIDQFKKKDRGVHESMTSIDGQLLLTRWKDNSAVTLASTVLGSHPTSKVRRYSRAQKKPIEVLRPHVVTTLQ